MDPKIKAKWIAALRSGEYLQTKTALRTWKGYCCLGVLCDVTRPKGWSRPTYVDDIWRHLGECGHLADELAAELEIQFHSQEWLVHLNDTGKSFAEIADYIEEKL